MEQYKATVPNEERQDGYLYDAQSGCLMGLGSEEQISKYGYNTTFLESRAGCPHMLVIHLHMGFFA